MEPKFMITGSGRCGTGYISKLLNAVGVRCGHESWWNPHDSHKPGLDGDSSWIGIKEIDSYQGLVLHQVRHPLDVISSFVKDPTGGEYKRIYETFESSLHDIDLGAKIWIRLNSIAEEKAALSWRVEDMNFSLFTHILDGIGVKTDSQDRLFALSNISSLCNYHGEGRRITWDELVNKEYFDDLRNAARYWGYV